MKFLSVFLVLLFVIVSPVQAQNIVRDIQVEGAQRVDESTVLSYLGIDSGDSVERADLDRGLKTLFATGLFADVVLEQSGDTLVVRVAENPVINRIVFEGNDKIEDEELLSEISLRSRQVFTRTKAQDDVSRIYQIYRRNGRFSSNVDPKVIKLDQNRVDLVFEISEGDVTKVKAIRFIGNEKFTDDKLRTEISTKESIWYSFISNADRYDPDRLAFDQDVLRQFYLSQGYADFELLSAVAELSNDRDGFYITFTVDEGKRYRVRDVKIESPVPEIDNLALSDQLSFESGDWYDSKEVQLSSNLITDKLGDLQYAFVNVRSQIERDRDEGVLDVTFRIDETPRAFIERIDISGNVRTLDKVIRREMLLLEGDPFNKSKLARSEQRIRDLNFFETVSFDVRQGSAPDQTVVDIKVVEKSTGEISLGAGFSTSDGVIGDIGLRERNLLGKGQDLRFSALLSADRTRFDVGLTEPYFLNRDVAAGFNVYSRETNDLDNREYDEQNTGGSLFLNYPLSAKWRQTLRYRLDQSDISDIDPNASAFLRAQEGERTTSAVSQRVTFDSRDSRLQPTSGRNFWFETEFAGLGFDSKYVSATTGVSQYYPLMDKVVLNVLGETGAIQGYGGEDVTVNERFTLGGPNSFRGFERYGVGPRTAADDDVGGNYFYRGTVQLNFPSGLPEKLGVGAAAFTDFGSLWNADEDFTDIVDEHALRMSVGLGLSWRSPFGPIGIYYAQPVIEEEYDQVKQFEFNFGATF